jgi:hypothetical protein
MGPGIINSALRLMDPPINSPDLDFQNNDIQVERSSIIEQSCNSQNLVFYISSPNVSHYVASSSTHFFSVLEESQWVWSKCWSFVFLISRLVFQHKLILHQLQDCSNDIAIPRSVGDHISPTIAPPIDCGAALP